jgi:hypothetical protein
MQQPVSMSPAPDVGVRALQPRPPLCVDLDGTLLRTDLLHEQVMLLVRQKPLALLSLPGWLLGGKAALKRRLAAMVRIDLGTLPLNEPLLDHLAASTPRVASWRCSRPRTTASSRPSPPASACSPGPEAATGG